ncbi:MAG: VOC family protein [Candidatus Muirbacterium halophilum]|nr:VOC family protein [Candidatus Muirbacterium halophilum]MCK9476593.1 VOC family protein [Candidatus Muirbacterium halophilum]
MKLGMFIIYVKEQNKSRDFYKQVFKINPILDVPGMTEFKIEGISIGIMPKTGISNILDNKVIHADEKSIKCELYFYVDCPEQYLEILEKNGGNKISDPIKRNWGDIVGYGTDLDGNVLAFSKKI